MTEFPDWLRGFVLVGKDGEDWRVLGVDENGYLGAILKAAAEVSIPDNVNVTQESTTRDVQGLDGETLRTLSVDSYGQLIMVPRGQAGYYMAVDASGYLTTILKGSIEGAGLHTVRVDAEGQIIMVPRGSGGNYLAVDENGYLGAILKAAAEVTIPGDVNVTQESTTRDVQGLDGETLRTLSVDSYGQLIMVPRGQSGNYLAIDASGYMASLMKGAYGEELETIAVDDEGNMISILKDTDDQWGKKISVGLAELAARLGSPVSWDRRGQVVQMLDFSEGLSQVVIGDFGAGAEGVLYPGVFQTGGYSLALTTGTNAAGYAQVSSYFVYSPADLLGFEVSLSSASRPQEIILSLYIYDGTYLHEPAFRFKLSVLKLQFQNPTPAWISIVDASPPNLVNFFFTVKFVVKLSTQRYVRLLYAGVETDMSSYSYPVSASAVAPYCYVRVKAVNSTAATHTVYLDRIVVTTNEPE